MDRSGKIGAAFIFLLGTPFALFGLWALGQAWQVLNRAPSKSPFWQPLIFGLIFSGIGFGLMSLVVFGARRYKKQMLLQAEHPAEPWLWREDWAEGRVASKTRGDMTLSWVFAILWNLISLPAILSGVPAAAKQKGPVVFIMLLFPAAGVYLLVRAIRQTLAYLEFGKTWFTMASAPGVIGRELKGTIEARFPHSPDHGVHIRLSCVHRVTTGSGNSRSTMETILWRDETDLAPSQLFAGPVGTTIPVAFHIPLDSHPAEKINPRDEYVWLLEALADVPGVNYHDIFEVPVFRTNATPSQAEEAAEQVRVSKGSTPARPDYMTVKVSQNSDGTVFYFPAARNKSFAVSTTVFMLMFSAITIFLTQVRIPIIFPIAFGFFAALLIYMTAQQWLGTTRVTIGSSLKFQDGMLGGGKVQEIALADVDSIDDQIRSRQGGTPYYDIILQLQSGRSYTLGRTIASKRETEWLMSEMRRLVGPQVKAASTAS